MLSKRNLILAIQDTLSRMGTPYEVMVDYGLDACDKDELMKQMDTNYIAKVINDEAINSVND